MRTSGRAGEQTNNINDTCETHLAKHGHDLYNYNTCVRQSSDTAPLNSQAPVQTDSALQKVLSCLEMLSAYFATTATAIPPNACSATTTPWLHVASEAFFRNQESKALMLPHMQCSVSSPVCSTCMSKSKPGAYEEVPAEEEPLLASIDSIGRRS